MHDSLVVRRFERVGDLTRDGQRFINSQGARSQSLGKRLPFNQLENERMNPVAIFEAVNRANVWMIDGRKQPRFAFEPRATIRVRSEYVGQNLDGNVATQLRIARTKNLSHPAASKQRSNLVRTNPLPNRWCDHGRQCTP